MLSATGANSLPSRPSSVSSGTNTSAMISTPVATGCATSVTARYSTCRRGRRRASSLPRRSTAFSTTTTAASTSMPMAIARPPRLIRLALMPVARIRMKVPSAASGSVIATTSAARSSPRNSSSSTTTSTAASSRASVTVPTARAIRSLRS
jgi:hypothetical protein